MSSVLLDWSLMSAWNPMRADRDATSSPFTIFRKHTGHVSRLRTHGAGITRPCRRDSNPIGAQGKHRITAPQIIDAFRWPGTTLADNEKGEKKKRER